MMTNYKLSIFTELLSLVVICLTTIAFPIENRCLTVVLLAVTGWVAAFIYKLTPYKTGTGLHILTVVWAVLSIGMIANVHCFTTRLGGTDAAPILLNPDAGRSWDYAMYFLGLGPEGFECEGHMKGYGLLLSYVFRITGPSLTVGLIINVLATMVTVIASGVISARLLKGLTSWSDGKVASWGMAMTAAVCYLTASGTLLIKDALVIMSMTLVALALTMLRQMPASRSAKAVMLAGYFVALAILFYVRHQYIIMAVVGIVMLTPRDKATLKRVLPILAITLVVFAWSYVWTRTSQIPNVLHGKAWVKFVQPNQAAYGNIIDMYLGWPEWAKALWLPISAGVQFFIPFPWKFTADIDWGYTQALCRMAYPWYAIGGMIILYWLKHVRKSPRRLQLFVLWGTLMWLVPAYLFAGTISRYGLALIPAMIPAAVYTVATPTSKKFTIIFVSIFTILIVSSLIIAHHLQTIA